MSKFTAVGTKGVGQAYDGPQFRKWDEYEVGETVSGKYLGKSEKPDKYGKRGHVLEVSESSTGVFAPGTQVILNSTGLLDKKMVHVEVNQEIQVRYAGKNKITKGQWAGSMAHNIELLVAGADATEAGDDEDI